MAIIRFTRNLYRFFPSLPTDGVEVETASVSELIDQLDARYDGIGSYLRDEAGRVRKHVAIYVDEELVQDRTTLTDPLSAGSEVFVAQALSGG